MSGTSDAADPAPGGLASLGGLGAPREGTLWSTAPRAWPRGGPLPPDQADDGMGAAFWRLQLVDRLDEHPELTVLRTEAAYLFDDGVIETAAEVADGSGDPRPVVAYARTGADVSALFTAVRERFEARGLPEPVCYAPGPLSLQAHGSQARLDPLKLQHFSPWPEALEAPEGTYALWWATDACYDPLGWEAQGEVARAIQASAGLEGHLMAGLLEQAGEVEPGTETVQVPDEPWETLLRGPDGLPVLATYRPEEGLVFRLHIESTPEGIRDLLWHHLAEMLATRRLEAEQWGIEPDELQGGSTWWKDLINGLHDLPKPPETLAPVER